MALSTRNVFQIIGLGLVFVFGFLLFHQGYSRLRQNAVKSIGPDSIQIAAHNDYSIPLDGHMFDAKDRYQQIKTRLTIGTLHWFSPEIERDAEEKFLGPPYEHEYHATQVSMCFHDDRILVVARIWLAKHKMWIGSQGRILGFKAPPFRNNFNDNWLLYQQYDKNMVPINYSAFLGIPSPSQYKYMDGPTDPKLFVYRGQPYLLFSMDMALNDTHDINYPIIWDFEAKGPMWIDIKGGSPFWKTSDKDYLKDRHWSPLVHQNTLFFVYSLDPLNILQCSFLLDKCQCTFINMPGSTFLFNEGITHLRGGTPFIHHTESYYISFAHSVMRVKEESKSADSEEENKIYSVHLVVLSTAPTFRLVFVSQPIQISEEIFKTSSQILSKPAISYGYALPVSLIQEDLNSYVLSLNIRDETSVAVRITGMKDLMTKIITQDRYKKPRTGPITNAIQDYIFVSLSMQSDETLVHEQI